MLDNGSFTCYFFKIVKLYLENVNTLQYVWMVDEKRPLRGVINPNILQNFRAKKHESIITINMPITISTVFIDLVKPEISPHRFRHVYYSIPYHSHLSLLK